LARVELGYLALSYESHRFDVVLAGMPSLVSKFTSLGMEEESGFCLFLKAAALEECARTDEAIQELLSLREFLAIGTSEPLARLVATKLGELFAQKGRYEEAFQYYREATHRLGAGEWNWVSANVKASVAVTLRDMGKFALAIDIMREALSDFDRVCSIAKAAYSRVLLAEILLLAGREREAEIEILAALPTIRKQSLVREGLAAGKLLREAIRRCGADKASLLGLCEYLRSRV
jgi:tetratricopeptide (TPR) repeat protein